MRPSCPPPLSNLPGGTTRRVPYRLDSHLSRDTTETSTRAGQLYSGRPGRSIACPSGAATITPRSSRSGPPPREPAGNRVLTPIMGPCEASTGMCSACSLRHFRRPPPSPRSVPRRAGCARTAFEGDPKVRLAGCVVSPGDPSRGLAIASTSSSDSRTDRPQTRGGPRQARSQTSPSARPRRGGCHRDSGHQGDLSRIAPWKTSWRRV